MHPQSKYWHLIDCVITLHQSLCPRGVDQLLWVLRWISKISGIRKAFLDTQGSKCTRLLFFQPFCKPGRHGSCTADMSRNSTNFRWIACTGFSISNGGTGSLPLRSLTILSPWASTPIFARPNCNWMAMWWRWMMSISQSACCLVSWMRERGPLGARRSALRKLANLS